MSTKTVYPNKYKGDGFYFDVDEKRRSKTQERGYK